MALTYTVIRPFTYGGTPYAFGDEIDLSAASANVVIGLLRNDWIDAGVGSGTYASAHHPPRGVPLLPKGVTASLTDTLTGRPLADRMWYAGLIEVDQAETLDELSVEVTAVGDGSAVIRLATAQVAADGTLVGESLTEHTGAGLDGTTTGVKTASTIEHALAAGRHAIFFLTNGESTTTPQVRWANIPPYGVTLGVSTAETLLVRSQLTASSYGAAFPATVPTFIGGSTSGSAVVAYSLKL